jgi:parallel beta-helix repeat protein
LILKSFKVVASVYVISYYLYSLPGGRTMKRVLQFLLIAFFVSGIAASVHADYQGTIGTRFIISGSGFGSSKSTVYLMNGGQKVQAKVEAWSESSITCLWTRTLPIGSYPLFVQPKGKGVPPVASGNFVIVLPSIDQITPSEGAAGDVITLNGRYFSSKRPKIYFENPDTQQRKACRVLNALMNPQTGISTLQFVIPKWGLARYNLILINAVGQTLEEFPFLDTSIYVDAVNGSDVNPGTSSEPFRTITHALSAAGSDHTIRVRPGTYNGPLGEFFPLVLQPGQILIGNEMNKGGGPTPTLIVGHGGSIPGGQWSSTIVGAEGSRVSGFEVGEDSYVVLHAAVAADGTTMEITNNTFKTPTYAGILLQNDGASVIENNVFDTASYGVYILGCPDGPTIRNNIFLQMSIPIDIVGIDTYAVISNNTITGNGQVGISVQHGHPLIENNTFNAPTGYTYGAMAVSSSLAMPKIRQNVFSCTTAITVEHGNPDLGTVSEHGNNDFRAVTGASLTHDGAATVYAIGNTWPSTPPHCGSDITVSSGGIVIWGSGTGEQCP